MGQLLGTFFFFFPFSTIKDHSLQFRNRTKSIFFIFHTYQKNIFYFSWIMPIISSWFLRIIHKLFNLMIIVNFLSSWILNFIIFEYCMSSFDNVYNFCILPIILFLSFGLKTTIYLVGTYKFFFGKNYLISSSTKMNWSIAWIICLTLLMFSRDN